MEIKSPTKISVIIPCLRGSRDEAEFVALIQSCLAQVEVSLEVLLVSNQQDDSLEARLKSRFANDSRFHYLETRRLGVNQARHLGALAAAGDILYFLDDDCLLPSRDHIKQALARLNQLPSESLLGGSYLGDQGVLGAAYHEMVTEWVRLGASPLSESSPTTLKVENLLGGNFFVTKKTYFKIPFQYSSPYGGEDTEFFRAHSDAGHGLYFCPEMSVRHLENNSVKKILLRAWCHGREREVLGLKSNQSKRARLEVFLTLFKKNKTVVWFFLIHFSIYAATYNTEK